MSRRTIVSTDQAPRAIGTYSQAVRTGSTVYVSGQLAFDPATMEIVEGGAESQARRVFENLGAIAAAAGGGLGDIVKLTIFLTDLADFPLVNAAMEQAFDEPYPARATVQIAALPKGAIIEVDAIMELDD